MPYSGSSAAMMGSGRKLPWLARTIVTSVAGYAVLQLEPQRLTPGRRAPASCAAVVGLLHGVLRRRTREPRAAPAFGGAVATGTFAFLPLLGRTPPPWRWTASSVATSLATQATYVAAIAAVHEGAREVTTGEWTIRLLD